MMNLYYLIVQRQLEASVVWTLLSYFTIMRICCNVRRGNALERATALQAV